MIVRLMGGLGNQMFQYAMGKMASKARNEKLYLDKFSYYRDKKRKCEIDVFKIKAHKLNVFSLLHYNILFYFGRNRKDSKEICYETQIFKYQDIIHFPAKYFVGSWQHEAYFKKIRNELRKEFTFNKIFSPEVEKMGKEISEKISIAVHVRRGDYLQCSDYAVQGIEYYEKAMQYISNRLPNAVFFVFSDDIEWCKEQFVNYGSITYISGNTGKEDFFLMGKCRHFIIANSTFSWWAAWLADKDAIKIAPAKWFVDENVNKNVTLALLREFCIVESEE